MDLDRLERVLRLFVRSRARELRVETEGWRQLSFRALGGDLPQPAEAKADEVGDV